MKNVLVGFFEVPGFGPDSVETPIVGSPQEEYARLFTAIRHKHPNAPNFRRIGSAIEPAGTYVEITPGSTLGQLFPGVSSIRQIGRAWFSGRPFNIVLAYNRAQSIVSVVLRGRMTGDGDIRFGGAISPSRLASELKQIIDETLGKEARDIVLNVREVIPKG